MSVQMIPGNFPHVYYLDLEGDGKVATECAVVKKDSNGNIYFITLKNLDQVDKQRIFNILHDRNVGNMELWDLMYTKTLGNGINALIYFHQFVKCLTAQGRVTDLIAGQMGLAAPKAPQSTKSTKSKAAKAE